MLVRLPLELWVLVVLQNGGLLKLAIFSLILLLCHYSIISLSDK
jgi:hypothetical protein